MDCSVGLSCFAFERKGLTQGSTLKVREYLACGLPAALGHHDPAFPEAFPYVLELSKFDFAALKDWLNSIGLKERALVREASMPFISVESLVSRQYAFAKEHFFLSRN